MTSADATTVGRRRLIWAAAAVVVAAAGLVLVQLYQRPRLYDQYLPPMHSFLSAVIGADSAALVATGAASQAVNWGVQAGRENPGAIRELASGLGATWGGPTRRPTGDSIVVLFRGPRDGICYSEPILVTFVGPPSDARVQSVSADCLIGRMR